MKKLLITGFEPFLDYPINPTMEVVKSLSGKVINGYEVHGEILTVNFSKSGEQLLEAVENLKPDAVISLGLAGDAIKSHRKELPSIVMMALRIIQDGSRTGKRFSQTGRTAFLQHSRLIKW